MSFAKILSGLNVFEISNLQEQETESRYPGDRDVTMLHGAETVESSFCGAVPHENLEMSERRGLILPP
jgi:hypothetical protein